MNKLARSIIRMAISGGEEQNFKESLTENEEKSIESLSGEIIRGF